MRCPGPLGSCSPVSSLGVLCCVCGVLVFLAPVHPCAGSVRCVARSVSRATWLMFTGVPAQCVVLLVRFPGPRGSCSPVYSHGVFCRVCDFSWANELLFTGVPAWCVASPVRCPGPFGSCSPVRSLAALWCVRGVLGHLAPVRRSTRALRCVACAVSWVDWLLLTGACASCVALPVRCPGPIGSCSPLCPLGVLCCVCGVLGPLAPVHQCARSVCCVVHSVSWAILLLFTDVPARCVVLRVRCPWLLGSCSPVYPLCVLCCACCVPCHLAPVHLCASSEWCVPCAVRWATWLLSLRAHLDEVPLNYPSETVVQPSSTAHFHYGFPTVEPLSWYSNKLLSSNLKTAIFQPCKRCHTP